MDLGLGGSSSAAQRLHLMRRPVESTSKHDNISCFTHLSQELRNSRHRADTTRYKAQARAYNGSFAPVSCLNTVASSNSCQSLLTSQSLIDSLQLMRYCSQLLITSRVKLRHVHGRLQPTTLNQHVAPPHCINRCSAPTALPPPHQQTWTYTT